MIKTIELIIIILLLVGSFFAGVKYSDEVKSSASWLLESRGEEEIELPDLASDRKIETTLPVDESIIEQDVDGDRDNLGAEVEEGYIDDSPDKNVKP